MNFRIVKNAVNREGFFIILLVVSMFIWGGSWTSGKIIAGTVHPLVLCFVRFFITFIAFIPVIAVSREKFSVDGMSLILILVNSLLLVLYNLLFFYGLKSGKAGAGGVLVTSINPIFTFLFSLLFFKKEIHIKEVIGLILGFAGGLVLLEIWNTGYEKLLSSGNFIFVTASVLWALISIISGEIQKKISLFVFSLYMYGIASVICFFIALPHNPAAILKMDLIFWINVLYLSVISTFFATSIYFFSSKKISANKTSSFILLVPFFAVIISFFILKEIPRIYTVAGGILSMISIYLINKKTNSGFVEII